MNIFKLAEQNALSLETRFTAVRGTHPDPSCLDRFSSALKSSSTVAINMRSWALVDLLERSTYHNIYEWAQEQSLLSTRPEEEILRERLGKYHKRRLAFDSAIENGRTLRYGSLYMGGSGPTNHGPFCVVMVEEFANADVEFIAYLSEDSLKSFVDSDGKVDFGSISENAASHSHRHLLGVLKHADDVATSPEESWPHLLCSSTDYIEAIFIGTVRADALEVVRLNKQAHDDYWDLAFANYGRRLGEGELAVGYGFVAILRALTQRGLSLEEVNNA